MASGGEHAPTVVITQPTPLLGNVFGLGLLIYVAACIFFNVGFFLTVGLPDTFTMTVVGLQSFLAQPIVPVAIYAISLLNLWVPFILLGIAIGVGRVIFEGIWARKPDTGTGRRRWLPEIPWIVSLNLGLAVVIAIFFVFLSFEEFIVLGGGGQRLLISCVGAMLCIAVVLYVELLPRGFVSAVLFCYFALFLMMISLRVGVSTGAFILSHSPNQKLELTNGESVIGTTIMAVPSGIVFSKYLGPRSRVAVLYGNERLLQLGPTPESERPSDPKIVFKKGPLLCDFLRSWGIDFVCASASRTEAVMLNEQPGQYVALPDNDPRAREAISVSEFRASGAQVAPKDDEPH